MSLMKFYTDALTSVDLNVTDDGFVKIQSGKRNQMVMVNKHPLVLPIKEQITSLNEVQEDGSLKVTKTLFNPLNEDVVKGESESLKKLKNMMDIKMSFTLNLIFNNLLKLGSDLDLQKKASLNLTSFISTLNKAKGRNVKVAVDENSIIKWNKIYEKNMISTATKGLIHTYLKRGGVFNNNKYNCLATINFPAYKELLKLDKKPQMYGIKLRPKDVEVYKLVYEFIFKDINEKDSFMLGSNDKKSPGFISLFSMYIHIGERLNELLNDLAFIDKDIVKGGKVNLNLTLEDIEGCSKYGNELAMIPSDLNASKKIQNRLLSNNKQNQTTNTHGTVNLQNLLHGTPQNQVVTNQQIPTVVEEPLVDTTGMSTAQKILYGTSPRPNVQQHRPMGVNNVQSQQQVPMNQIPLQQFQQQPQMNNYQQQPVYQQSQQRPMGVNNMQQQQVPMQQYQQQQMNTYQQQPVYQQHRPMGVPGY